MKCAVTPAKIDEGSRRHRFRVAVSDHGVGWIEVCLEELPHFVGIFGESDEFDGRVGSQDSETWVIA